MLAGIIRWMFGLGFGLFLCLLLGLAFWHRKIYSENCLACNQWAIKPFGRIQDPEIDESSGLAFWKKDLFYTHNDDTDSSLYLLNAKGKRLKKWTIPYTNRDWEDLSMNASGKLFLGDFGNNLNADRPLKIYIIDPTREKVEGIIRFRYAEQTRFPPLWPGQMNFDCEAMVAWKDSIYLFTKNKSERNTWVYVLPARPGSYVIRKKLEMPILGLVTAAALRPDGQELALLTYGKIYFYHLSNGLAHIDLSNSCLAYWQFRQSESLSYWGRDSLLAGNEQGELFLVTRK
jgi:hypothetical protein